MEELLYVDLFAGSGGLSLGLHEAGWKGLFAVEKNKDAFNTLKYNLIDEKNHFYWPQWLQQTNLDIKDLLKLYKKDLKQLKGKISLVVGGPPCQGFSMAGKRNGDDIRNSLCHSYIEFIKLVIPKVIFFENVHGFTIGFDKDGEKGQPFSEITINQLTKLGYKVKGKIIDVSQYGVPQKRKRFILIGVRHGDPNIFFNKLDINRDLFIKNKKINNYITIEQAIGDLKKSNGTIECPDSKGFKSGKYGKCTSKYQRAMRKGNKKTLVYPDSHRFANHREDTVTLFEKLMAISDNAIRITPSQNLVDGLKKRGITPLKANSICTTVTSIPDDFVHYCEPRIMTVREMARIQSFPDWYEFKGKYTTGGELRKVDVPRYTQVANAVPPLFAEQVGIVLKEMLSNE